MLQDSWRFLGFLGIFKDSLGRSRILEVFLGFWGHFGILKYSPRFLKTTKQKTDSLGFWMFSRILRKILWHFWGWIGILAIPKGSARMLPDSRVDSRWFARIGANNKKELQCCQCCGIRRDPIGRRVHRRLSDWAGRAAASAAPGWAPTATPPTRNPHPNRSSAGWPTASSSAILSMSSASVRCHPA